MAATLSWVLPSGRINNTFSVTLVSGQALQNVLVDDFVLQCIGWHSTDGGLPIFFPVRPMRENVASRVF